MAERVVLGLTSYLHESAAALLKDGVLLAAASEERFNREKLTTRFPEQAVRFCLEEAGLKITDVTDVAFFWKPFKGLVHRATWYARKPIFAYKNMTRGSIQHRGSVSSLIKFATLKKELKKHFPEVPDHVPVHYIDHHHSHAASAYYCSPFEESAILTLDTNGERTATRISLGKGNQITPLFEYNYPNSLGLLYGAMTQFLGFKVSRDEYKVMGLAGYGKPVYTKEFDQIIRLYADGRYQINPQYFDYQYGAPNWYSKKVIQLFGEPRVPESKITSHHENIAATLQHYLDEAGVNLAKRAKR